jgi:type VI protein secretion system component VasK
MVGLDLESPATLQEAIEQLEALSQTDGPIIRLFQTLAEHVRLKGTEPLLRHAVAEAGGAATDSVQVERAVSPVEQQFRGMLAFAFGDAASSSMSANAPLFQYVDQLRSLEVSLRELRDQDAEIGANFEAQLAGAARTVERLLQPLDKGHRLAVERLLMSPVHSSQSLVRRHDAVVISDKWRADVLARGQSLARYYPFDVRARDHAPLQEFSAFLAPKGGALWKFFEMHLAARVQESGARFILRTSTDRTVVQPAFLDCLNAAKEIRDAVFATDAAVPSVPFAIRLSPVGENVSSLVLDVDGQSAIYKNEPERWQSMTWPGDTGMHGASIRARGPGFADEIRHDGEFGWIRLLTDGGIRPVGEDKRVLEASWSLRHGATRVRIQIRPATDAHPFRFGFFTQLDCTAQLFNTKGGFGG